MLGGGAFLDRCTMSRNVAREDGGGLYVWRFAALRMHSSIVLGDRPNQILIDLVHPEQIEVRNSIVEDDLI